MKEWKKCVLCDDSRNVIKRIPDNSIDFILTDPPYNIGKHSTGNIPLPGRSAMNNDVAEWDHIDFNPEEWADEFIRILKPTGNLFIFTSYNQLGRWYDCLDRKFDTSNFMVWHKTNPAPKIFKAGFLNSCEMIFTCWNKKHTWNFISQAEMHNFIESPICMRPERLKEPKHPAQKPVAILKKMIEIASNSGDIVFDPFMGVGSTGVAALSLNRKFIGVELDRTYFEAAKKRIDNEMTTEYNQAAINDNIVSEPAAEYITSRTSLADVFPLPQRNLHSAENRNDVSLSPIIKWPGGKERELKYIKENLPKEIENFYEPFVGGGSVFTSIKANRYFINDKSEELTSLYRFISEKNTEFYKYAYAVSKSWDNMYEFTKAHTGLFDLYNSFKQDIITQTEFKQRIEKFCSDNNSAIILLVNECFREYGDILVSEIKKNITRKMARMKTLEKERHELPEKDIYDNIETALKSALYMFYRHLYNNKSIKEQKKEMHGALFLFIRNYCYSGMFRYNANGEFNVPYGGIAYNGKSLIKKLEYYQSEPLLKRFEITDIENLDFEKFMQNRYLHERDFVFLDPPYDTEFSTYAQNEFGKDDQKRLADFLINNCRAKWMLIIKNTPFIYGLYNKDGITIKTFDKNYAVSFMNRNDKKAEHLIIMNYDN